LQFSGGSQDKFKLNETNFVEELMAEFKRKEDLIGQLNEKILQFELESKKSNENLDSHVNEEQMDTEELIAQQPKTNKKISLGLCPFEGCTGSDNVDPRLSWHRRLIFLKKACENIN
jgi:hypothetical protein